MGEAFKGADYADPISYYPKPAIERAADVVLAVIVGICLAAALVHWWSS